MRSLQYYISYCFLVILSFVGYNLPLNLVFTYLLFFGSYTAATFTLLIYTFGIKIKYLGNQYLDVFANAVTTFCKRNLFKNSIIKNVPQYPKKSGMLLCIHPHGLYLTHFLFIVGMKFMRSFTVLVHDILFYVPLLNIIVKTIAIDRVEKEVFTDYMEKNENIAIFPGGQTEIALYEYEKHAVYLKNRKGFIKTALQYGYKLIPCYIFSETSAFKMYSLFDKKTRLSLMSNRETFKNFICFVTAIGVGKLPLVMFDTDYMTVFGDPIELPLIESPTQEDIDHWHLKYTKSLKQLFYENIDEWKRIHPATKSVELEIY